MPSKELTYSVTFTYKGELHETEYTVFDWYIEKHDGDFRQMFWLLIISEYVFDDIDEVKDIEWVEVVK